MRHSATGRGLLIVCLASSVGACSTGGAPTPSRSGPGPPVIRVASFNFPESVLLAELYGQALQAAGFDVSFSLDLGSREIVEPALEQGFVDLVPEYLGSALQFTSLGQAARTSSVPDARAALARALRPRGLVALGSAPAEDQDAIVVRASTAARYHLLTITDLVPFASKMTFGAPAECLVRDSCLKALERVYGLRFADVLALDASGNYTVSSLRTGAIGAGLLFSTDGRLPADGLVALIDDRGLEPAENVTPVIRRGVLARLGARLRAVLDAVSAKLTTEVLTGLNKQVTVDHASADLVAAHWLREQGLGA